jgi:hypothetical protein
VERVFAGRYRPSTFLTLTLDSYGRVDAHGAAINPADYDYRWAARDAIHFPALVDRFWQNTRRCVGWDVQYFGTVEPQKRGAPYFHAAIRGADPRAELRAITKRRITRCGGLPMTSCIDTPMVRTWRSNLLRSGVSESMSANAYRLLRVSGADPALGVRDAALG